VRFPSHSPPRRRVCTPAPAPPLPLAAAAWTPPAGQEHYYAALFSYAEDGTGAVSGAAAVAFFSRSGLERPVLKAVWEAANLRGGKALSRHEFYIAMRLLSVAQAGAAPVVSREALLATAAAPLPPPRFEGPYAISPDDAVKFEALFRATDTDGDGLVGGDQAVSLFVKSGLDRPTLKTVWGLSDLDRDGKLDADEFAVAMALVVGASKRGRPVPPVLPLEMVPPRKANLLPPLTHPAAAAAAAVPAAHPPPPSAPPAAAVVDVPPPVVPVIPAAAASSRPTTPSAAAAAVPVPAAAASPGGLAHVSAASRASVSSLDDAFGALPGLGALGGDATAPTHTSAAAGLTPHEPAPAFGVQPKQPSFAAAAPAVAAAPPAPVPESLPSFGGGLSSSFSRPAAAAGAPAAAHYEQPSHAAAAPAHATSSSSSSSAAAATAAQQQLLDSRRAATAAARSEVAALEAARGDLAAQAAALRAAADAEDAEHARLTAQIAALKAELAAAQAGVGAAAAGLAGARGRTGVARGVAAALAAQLAAATGRGDALSDEARTLLARVGAAEVAVARLAAARADIDGVAAQHAASAESNDDEAAALTAAVAGATARLARLDGEKATLLARLAAAGADVTGALEALRRSEAALDDARSAHEAR
jgi:epidermal growth factor receptor substrate 15